MLFIRALRKFIDILELIVDTTNIKWITYIIVVPELLSFRAKTNAEFKFIRCWWQSVLKRERIIQHICTTSTSNLKYE